MLPSFDNAPVAEKDVRLKPLAVGKDDAAEAAGDGVSSVVAECGSRQDGDGGPEALLSVLPSGPAGKKTLDGCD
eukprot:11159416-Lingulodinium_polyedra.AAC.1